MPKNFYSDDEEEYDEEEDERAWMRLAGEQFLKGYAPEDAIYDDLEGEPEPPPEDKSRGDS